MAYPFLPVNPSCSNVVINDVCGCSSVVTNNGCNSNDPCSTLITASNTIVYNGPALSCIIAEPCDTLNVILQKIDEIICNLLMQINTLNIQVNNIYHELINIDHQLIIIHDTLDVCCNVTTTTTTTIVVPCESFSLTNTSVDPIAIIITDCATGLQEAILILPGDTNICVETDSPLTVPGTIIVTPNGPCGISTTTTTTTTPPTTTTTTTVIPCECLAFTNTDSVAHSISYKNCMNEVRIVPIGEFEVLNVCGCCGEANSSLVTITIGTNCIDGVCPTPLINCIFIGDANEITTTTTTTIAPTSTTTTTTECIRPIKLIDISYFNTYTIDSIIIDYTGSLLEACTACNFIYNNPFLIEQETSLWGQSDIFAIGQYVYAGLVTNCVPLANGFYITDHETCQITEIVDGYIVNITNCEIIPTTTTTTTNNGCIQYIYDTTQIEPQSTVVTLEYTECITDTPITITQPAGDFTQPFIFCSTTLPVIVLGTLVSDGPCITTTTTTTVAALCKIYTVLKTVEPAAGWEATLCVDGSIVSGNANSSGSLNTPCVVQDSLILDAGVEIRDINECDACISYTVECFYILGGTWSADDCNGVKVGGPLSQFESVSTGCIQIATLSLIDVVITALEGLCTTTTTTTLPPAKIK